MLPCDIEDLIVSFNKHLAAHLLSHFFSATLPGSNEDGADDDRHDARDEVRDLGRGRTPPEEQVADELEPASHETLHGGARRWVE